MLGPYEILVQTTFQIFNKFLFDCFWNWLYKQAYQASFLTFFLSVVNQSLKNIWTLSQVIDKALELQAF